MVRLHELVAKFYREQLAGAGRRGRARATSSSAASTSRPPRSSTSASRRRAGRRCRATSRRRRSPSSWPSAPGSSAAARTARHFDTFVNRVVYALTSPMGEVIGFGGRVINPEDQPKYKNSPETLLFKKGENLFGLHARQARHPQDGGRALVVEGNFDVMTLHQDGVDYAVAPQGTAMTAEQVKLLGRFAKRRGAHARRRSGRARGDDEGHAPVRRGRAAAAASRSCAPRDGKKQDPDELARNDLPQLQALIDSAQDAVEFYFEQVASTSAPTVPGRVAAIEECAPLLRSLRDPLARDLYVDKLAQLLKVDVGPGAARRCARRRPHVSRKPARRRRRRGAGAARRSRCATWRQRRVPLHALLAAGLPGAARRLLAARGRRPFERRRSARVGCLARRSAVASTRHGCSTDCRAGDSRRRRQGARVRRVRRRRRRCSSAPSSRSSPPCAFRPICRRS